MKKQDSRFVTVCNRPEPKIEHFKSVNHGKAAVSKNNHFAYPVYTHLVHPAIGRFRSVF